MRSRLRVPRLPPSTASALGEVHASQGLDIIVDSAHELNHNAPTAGDQERGGGGRGSDCSAAAAARYGGMPNGHVLLRL